MKNTDPTVHITNRGIAALTAGVALCGVVLGGLAGQASGAKNERSRFISSSPGCDIPVRAGDSFASFNARMINKLHETVPTEDMDEAGNVRTSDNSANFPNPAYYPRIGDTLHAGHLPESVCVAIGGQVLSASQMVESSTVPAAEPSHQ